MTRLNHEKLAPAPKDSFAAADVFGSLMASDLSFASASEFNDLFAEAIAGRGQALFQ